MTSYLDQPAIGRMFGVSVNTVQSSWRNATLRALREHLAEADTDPQMLGMAVEQVTRLEWETARRRLGVKPLKLPNIALPLPDAVMGNKPGWLPATIGKWADDTGRRGDDGTPRRSSPPGRPRGVVETAPRRRQASA